VGTNVATAPPYNVARLSPVAKPTYRGVPFVDFAVRTVDAVALHLGATLPGDLQLDAQPLAGFHGDVDSLALN
jgi:hypothetical protein